MCIDFKMLKVKVPMIFFGTPVFSARRDRRYSLLPCESFQSVKPKVGGVAEF